MAELSCTLRTRRHGESFWQSYEPIFNAQQMRPPEIKGKRRLRLLGANHCRFSHIFAIRLVAELLEVGHRLKLQWRTYRHNDMPFESFKTYLDKFRYSSVYYKVSVVEETRAFATDLCDALNGAAPSESTAYEFEGVVATPESEAFSIDAAHLQSMLAQYDKESASFEERLGTSDPFFVDLIPVDVLANQVCLMANARDVGKFWFGLMEKTTQQMGLYTNSDEEFTSDEEEEERSSSIDAPYHCTGCRATADRFDAHFRLPFCAQAHCMNTTFAKLHVYGLYRPA